MNINKAFFLYLYIIVVVVLIFVVLNKCFKKSIEPNLDVPKNDSAGIVINKFEETVVPDSTAFPCSNYENWEAIENETLSLINDLYTSLNIIANPRDASFEQREQHYERALNFFETPTLDSVEMNVGGTKKKKSIEQYLLDLLELDEGIIYEFKWDNDDGNASLKKDDMLRSGLNLTHYTSRYRKFDLWRKVGGDKTVKNIELKLKPLGSSCVLRLGNISLSF